MIGSKQFEISYADLTKSMSSSGYVSDGGYSNETIAINPLPQPGGFYGAPTILDRSSNLINGNVIMSSGDATYLGATKFLGTDTGYFYSVNSAFLPTARQSAVAGTYVSGYSDMVQFGVGSTMYTYVTTTTDIVRMTGDTLSGLDATWWTVTMGKTALGTNPIGGATGVTTAHPMLVYEDSLWIADFNKIHKFDGTTASYGFLVLPIDQTIVALGIDPSTGKMLISTTQGANAADSVPKQCKILIWDGFSSRPIRSVIVDDMVTAIYPVGGTVFMPFGLNLGYWNGSGVSFLRKLKNATYDANLLVYKQRITSIGKTLYVMDGIQVLAFGEIMAGEKRFYYANKATAATAAYFTAILNLGSNELGLCYASNSGEKVLASFGTFYTTLTNNIAYFYSNKYDFLRAIQVKEVIVEYIDSIAAAGSGGALALLDPTGSYVTSSSLTNDSSAAVFQISSFPVQNPTPSTYIQLRYENVSNKGIKRFLISYDYVE